MKLYGIHSGCRFEGGGVHSELYTNPSDARLKALEIVDQRQDRDNALYKDDKFYNEHPEVKPVSDWKEERKDYWSNSIDEVKIVEFDIVLGRITVKDIEWAEKIIKEREYTRNR